MPQEPRPRILVVDDEPVVASLCAYVLEEEGYEVHTANDSGAAIAAATEQQFDGALVDVGLINGTALDVASALRARTPGMGVVGMTAEPAHLTLDRSWVDLHLHKPFRKLGALGSALSAARAMALRRQGIAAVKSP